MCPKNTWLCESSRAENTAFPSPVLSGPVVTWLPPPEVPVVTWLPPLEVPVTTWHLVGKLSVLLETVSRLNGTSLSKALLMCGFCVLLAFHVLNMKLVMHREGNRYEGWKRKRH